MELTYHTENGVVNQYAKDEPFCVSLRLYCIGIRAKKNWEI